MKGTPELQTAQAPTSSWGTGLTSAAQVPSQPVIVTHVPVRTWVKSIDLQELPEVLESRDPGENVSLWLHWSLILKSEEVLGSEPLQQLSGPSQSEVPPLSQLKPELQT